MWIAGVCVCLLATSGIVAFVRSFPASYASIPDEGAAPSTYGAAPAAIERRNRTSCPECGVIESMREIERSANVKDTGVIAGGNSGRASAANAVSGKDYEVTIRFRDGSTTVLNQASPGTWRLGGRVVVVGRSTAANN